MARTKHITITLTSMEADWLFYAASKGADDWNVTREPERLKAANRGIYKLMDAIHAARPVEYPADLKAKEEAAEKAAEQAESAVLDINGPLGEKVKVGKHHELRRGPTCKNFYEVVSISMGYIIIGCIHIIEDKGLGRFRTNGSNEGQTFVHLLTAVQYMEENARSQDNG